MNLLVTFMRGCLIAIGITLPKPEHEKRVAIIWLLAGVVMVAIVFGTGWLVLNSMSSSMNPR
jgi:hypothetical protein